MLGPSLRTEKKKSNPTPTPLGSSVGHSEDDMAYLCSQNLQPFVLKCNTKFLEKYKRSLIFGSVYIYTFIM